MNILDLSFNNNFSDSESDGMSIDDISLSHLNKSIEDLKNSNNDLSYNILCKSINVIKYIGESYINDEWIEINTDTNKDNFEIINNK
tara:strand:+ start:8921 stop:9181 length:261 start_codon:yes stop_codon:yes gene_type:complete